jgi:putative transposase
MKAGTKSDESGNKWMRARFEYKGKYLKRITRFKFWEDGNHAQVIYTPEFFYEKLAYIHNNPVRAMIVGNPEDYLFSSARNYSGASSLIDVVLETPRLVTVR